MDVFDLLKLGTLALFYTKASIDDIKTTEIRDFDVYFFVSMLIFLNILQFFYYKDLNILINFAISALIFGSIGFLLYFTGQWGMGDSYLLFSFGLLNLFDNILEIMNWVLVTFIFGIYFIFIYSFIFIFVSKKIEEMKIIESISMFLGLMLLIFSILFAISKEIIAALFLILMFLYVSIPFLNFAKNSLIKKVKVSELKEGDVLLEFKVWRGITKKEIEELKRKKIKYVYVKEGVRYAPTFLFVLIVFIFEKIFGITIFSFYPLNYFLI
ncbi:MAG: hypothetical protein QXL82_02660 [Candidatus Aenigmatarchaeota archaeon]